MSKIRTPHPNLLVGTTKNGEESNSCPISCAHVWSAQLDFKKAAMTTAWGLLWVEVWQPQCEQLLSEAKKVGEGWRGHEA